MFAQKFEERILHPTAHRFALSRTNFVKEFCAENDDDRAAPVGNGVSAESAEMALRIEANVTGDPEEKKNERDDGQRMTRPP